MTVQELITQLSKFPSLAYVVAVEVITTEEPSITSFSIDDIQMHHGFVQLISID